MPARSPTGTSPLHSALGQRRRSGRRACSDPARVRVEGREYAARFIDISAGGAGLRIETLLPLRPGLDMVLIHAQMGELPCHIRWSMHPRYGVEFRAGSHALASAITFYDSLPTSAGDVT